MCSAVLWFSSGVFFFRVFYIRLREFYRGTRGIFAPKTVIPIFIVPEAKRREIRTRVGRSGNENSSTGMDNSFQKMKKSFRIILFRTKIRPCERFFNKIKPIVIANKYAILFTDIFT